VFSYTGTVPEKPIGFTRKTSERTNEDVNQSDEEDYQRKRSHKQMSEVYAK